MGTFSDSWRLTKVSFGPIFQDSALLVFPLVGVLQIVSALGFGVLFALLGASAEGVLGAALSRYDTTGRIDRHFLPPVYRTAARGPFAYTFGGEIPFSAKGSRSGVTLSPYSVAVVVSNGKRAVRYYTQKLRLDLLENAGHWRVVGRKRKGGLAIHLCEYGGPTPKAEKGNTGILLLTDEPMEATYRKLRKKGVKFSIPPKQVEWGWQCQIRDPDGNELWIAPTD
jgi:predicted enzyme related to lactoylglutathione lyase